MSELGSPPDIVWPAGTWEVMQLRHLQVGMILAPAEWQTCYLQGRAHQLPFAAVSNTPIILKVMPPGAGAFQWQCKIPYRSADGPHYYTARPEAFVRVIIPEGGRHAHLSAAQ